jgi:hypothetical protein
MNRREALKAVGLLMGGTLIGAETFLSGCSTEQETQVNKLFTDTDVALMDEIAETIIPETDTPGAKKAGVGSFMAMMVLDCYEPDNQKIFTEGLDKVQADFKEQYGHTFMKGTAEERHDFLSRLNEELDAYRKQAGKGDKEHYFRIMKELTLLGYFSSEIGCTQALRYVETPGRYEGCVPYKKGERAWAI